MLLQTSLKRMENSSWMETWLCLLCSGFHQSHNDHRKDENACERIWEMKSKKKFISQQQKRHHHCTHMSTHTHTYIHIYIYLHLHRCAVQPHLFYNVICTEKLENPTQITSMSKSSWMVYIYIYILSPDLVLWLLLLCQIFDQSGRVVCFNAMSY